MGVEVLVQIDRLVQLLETPIFTYLRLQLLQPARYPDLIRCAAHASPCAVLLKSANYHRLGVVAHALECGSRARNATAVLLRGASFDVARA